MTDHSLSDMTDVELDLWISRKCDLLARATSLLDGADAEVEKYAGLVAESELHERPDLNALRQAFQSAMLARSGRRGAHGSAKSALDAALAEQRRRTEANARSAADAARLAFKEHVVRIGAEITASAATVATMMAQLHELAQKCRGADHDAGITHGRFDDPYPDNFALDGAMPGLHETARTMVEFTQGKLGAQLMHANAAFASEAAKARRAG
jgi:hypothetical protein